MSDFTVKAVNTAVSWEYEKLPASKLRCALCLVNCSETAEGPSQSVGIVRLHSGGCGAVMHEACLAKYRETPNGASCPQCHQQNAKFEGPIDLFEVKQ